MDIAGDRFCHHVVLVTVFAGAFADAGNILILVDVCGQRDPGFARASELGWLCLHKIDRTAAGNLMTETEDVSERVLAYMLLRITLGMNIAVHGVSRLIAGPGQFAHSLEPMFEKTFLPGWSVYTFGLVLPFVEALLGVLVLVGLQTRHALVGGSLLILVLTFGSTLRQDWESAGLQLIYASLYAGLLAFVRYNHYSLDALLSRTTGWK